MIFTSPIFFSLKPSNRAMTSSLTVMPVAYEEKTDDTWEARAFKCPAAGATSAAITAHRNVVSVAERGKGAPAGPPAGSWGGANWAGITHHCENAARERTAFSRDRNPTSAAWHSISTHQCT